jgi:cytoskeletal protein RodZ
MPTVAEQLRHGREAMKLDVYQVAEVTKIRTDHIRALEAGDYDQFVAPVYIRGFVRTYATLLKLEVPQVMADLNAELGRTERFAEPPALTRPQQGGLDSLLFQLSRIDWRILLAVLASVLVLTGAVAGYRLWHAHKTSDPLKDLSPAQYHPRAGEPGETLPVPGK